MSDHFGFYLMKYAASIEDLARAGGNAGGSGTPTRDAVESAVKQVERGKASKAQIAMLLALGVGVGASGVLLYQQHKRRND